MDAKLKAKWIEALRSGKYKQAKMSLIDQWRGRGGPSFCCLGVLCDVAGTKWLENEEGELEGISVRSELGSYLSEEMLTRVNLDNRNQELLAKMNDRGKSFPEIADYIEANL